MSLSGPKRWAALPAASNRGNSLLDLGRMDEALRAHETAVERDPASSGARYNLALTQFRLGDWEQGWPAYEARWDFREVHRTPRRFDRPRWHGELLDGRRVLLHAEQGLGDTIQFCRYATLVAARGGVPILEVQAPVARLLRSLAVVRAGLAEITVLGDRRSRLRSGMPADEPAGGLWHDRGNRPVAGRLSRRRARRDRAEAIPVSEPAKLGGRPAHRNCLGRQSAVTRPTISGRSNSKRYCPWCGRLAFIGSHCRRANRPVSLPICPALFGSAMASSSDRDLGETAALMATLDLVITTDTCIAHLAGAMGKPVWILLPHLADWRWMQDVETTPWYPTARLIRQTAPGDWDGVLARMVTELRWLLRMQRTQWKWPRRGTRARPARAA